MYCEILEEEETVTTEEEEMDETEEKEMAKTVEDKKDEDQNTHLKRDIILHPTLNVEGKEISEIKAEPEKFQTNCCSIS